jgi:hypothetical protein
VISIAAVVAVAIVSLTAMGDADEPPPPVAGPPSFATPTRPPAGSVFAYYEVLDADGALLYERVLDGSSLPRLIVERPSSDFSRTYAVDPVGRTALAMFPDEDSTSLEAIDVVTGTTLWRAEAPLLDPESGVWSADGRRWAALVAEVEFEAGPSVVIADIASGATAVVALDERAWPQGFTGTGTLILTERAEDLRSSMPWRFLGVDAATGAIVRLGNPPPVGPHSFGTDDVAPAAGLGAGFFFADDGSSTVEVRQLTGGGAWESLAEFEFVERIALSPGGDAVAVSADGTILVVGLDGTVSELWDGPEYAELTWAASGRFLGVSGWSERPLVTVIELATGRVVELPLPEAIAEGRLVAVVGDRPLAANALPPGGDPEPSPSPEPTGPPVAGAVPVVLGWMTQVDGVPVANVEIRVPTQDGGVRTIATMPPLELEDLAGSNVRLSVAPRPGGPDILLALDSDELTQAWLWDPASGRLPFPFPEGWPTSVSEIHWRPDGRAIASTTLELAADPLLPPPEGDAVVVVAELDTSIVRQYRLPEEYPTLDGWWSDDELRMARDPCFEGCPGRFAYEARLRLADGALRPFTATERPPVPVHVPFLEFDPAPVITLSSINELTSDDVIIQWPLNLPAIDGSIVLWASPEPDLLVSAPVAGATELYRIQDPLGRAVDGRLTRPTPIRVATLPVLAQDPSLAPDGRWLTVRDRAGGLTVVDLHTDRRWGLGPSRDGDWSWLSPPSAAAP